MMTYIQNYDTCKINLTIAINFIFSKDVEEVRVMHSSSDNKNLHLMLMTSLSHFGNLET